MVEAKWKRESWFACSVRVFAFAVAWFVPPRPSKQQGMEDRRKGLVHTISTAEAIERRTIGAIRVSDNPEECRLREPCRRYSDAARMLCCDDDEK